MGAYQRMACTENNLYREQCRLHLEDDKGTYGKVEKTKEDILEDVLLKLKGILIPFKKHGEGWKAVCESIIRDATTVEKEGKLCKFYLIWKLHKPECSWNPDPTHSGGDRLHNWPCITFSTLSTAARGLEAQECLKRLAGSYSNLRELQRDVQIQTHDRRCCCPLPLYQTGPRNGRFTMVHG